MDDEAFSRLMDKTLRRIPPSNALWYAKMLDQQIAAFDEFGPELFREALRQQSLMYRRRAEQAEE